MLEADTINVRGSFSEQMKASNLSDYYFPDCSWMLVSAQSPYTWDCWCE